MKEKKIPERSVVLLTPPLGATLMRRPLSGFAACATVSPWAAWAVSCYLPAYIILISTT